MTVPLNLTNKVNGTFSLFQNVTAFADNRTNDGRVYTFSSKWANQNQSTTASANVLVLSSRKQNFSTLYEHVNATSCEYYA